MFTGLIEELGSISSVYHSSKGAQLKISAKKICQDLHIGDSVSTNGVCLTVVNVSDTSFVVDVMPETMRMSNIQNAKKGMKVNLERALRIGDRLGGHIVSGHVDGRGKIQTIKKEDNATWVEIELDQDLMKYIIEKGSVAIDGTSLTVARVTTSSFWVSIIPLTGEETTLLSKAINEEVNIECDVIGKYVENMMGCNHISKQSVNQKDTINMEFLGKHGFL